MRLREARRQDRAIPNSAAPEHRERRITQFEVPDTLAHPMPAEAHLRDRGIRDPFVIVENTERELSGEKCYRERDPRKHFAMTAVALSEQPTASGC